LKKGKVYFLLKPEISFEERKSIVNENLYYPIDFDKALHIFTKKHDFDLLYQSLKESIKNPYNFEIPSLY